MNQSGTLNFHELSWTHLNETIKTKRPHLHFYCHLKLFWVSKYPNIWSLFPTGTNTCQADKVSVTSIFRHTAPDQDGLTMGLLAFAPHTHTSISGDASESKEKSGVVLKGFASSVNQWSSRQHGHWGGGRSCGWEWKWILPESHADTFAWLQEATKK